MSRFKQISLSLIRTILPLLILGVGVGGFLVFGQKAKPPEQNDAKEKVPTVKTITIVERTKGFPIRVDGNVVPYREIKLSAEVAGRIVEREQDLRAGSYVKANDFLARIDPTDYQSEIDRLEQEELRKQQAIEELKVEIKNTKNLLAIAEKDFTIRNEELSRMKDLFQRGGLSRTDLEAAYRNTLNAENAQQLLDNQAKLLEAKEAGLLIDKKLTGVQLARAKVDKKRTEIVSPINGVIVSESIQKDDYVQKGQELFVIEDTDKVEVVTNLRMEELQWIWESAPVSSEPKNAYALPALKATVTYSLDGRETTWDAKLSRYDGLGLDERTRMVPVRLEVAQPQQSKTTMANEHPMRKHGPRALVRGMFVSVEIPLAPQTRLLSIPEKGIRPGNQVWLVRDDKLVIREVNVAHLIEGTALVLANTSDIEEGDEVIVSPLPLVKKDMAVNVEK